MEGFVKDVSELLANPIWWFTIIIAIIAKDVIRLIFYKLGGRVLVGTKNRVLDFILSKFEKSFEKKDLIIQEMVDNPELLTFYLLRHLQKMLVNSINYIFFVYVVFALLTIEFSNKLNLISTILIALYFFWRLLKNFIPDVILGEAIKEAKLKLYGSDYW